MAIPDPTAVLPSNSPAAAALRRGRELRAAVPRRALGDWVEPKDRDVVATLMASNEGRLEDLIPIRIGRMLASPFVFLRGSAAVMAGDVALSPQTGLIAQLCGDAHLANFGVYASPERRLVFDLNDFDETERGPWEWDVKRLAASVVVASRENGYSESTCRDLARDVGRFYRHWMHTYAGMRALEVWYSVIPIEAILERVERARRRRSIVISIEEARRRDHLAALGKLSTRAPDGSFLFRHRPPLLQRLPEDDPDRKAVPEVYEGYLRTLRADRRLLVERHRLIDVALKVVGVGSVGTRCYVALLVGPAGGPLIMQVKEARESVLAPYVNVHKRSHQGKRVVAGQRIMQAVSDVFLGWTQSQSSGVDFYVRQLHDMKYGIDIAGLRPPGMALYAEVCAWALARAHARSGNPAEIAGYLGPGEVFDDALASFAIAYADQTERDHESLVKAVRAGRIEAVTGV